MPNIAYEAVGVIVFYNAPIYGRSVRLQSYAPNYWSGFNQAIDFGYVEELDTSSDFRKEFRLTRKGYDYAVLAGIIEVEGNEEET